ncbi:MAG TPA: ABC transporter substrate-binding protein [Candidatus Binatus sp.]|uniref:MlaC/ttg2D family ABC transporter substrate-binding protein n=1 Tax=Candidatus Binatus sp. TaxID=2811406 RepID=UPI002B4A6DCE|nr:ABC transporter substrate-binding protein [Candidatus Binatus sp.]HKN13081.1 ABC transporter substrate-binding protein [Candidatus Binatus sp.]
MKQVKYTITRTSIQRLLRHRALAMLTLTAVLVLSLAPSRFLAPAWADDPMSVVQTTVNRALSVLRDNQTPLAQRQDKLRQIVSATFDFTEMAKSALGYHWKQITAAQQQEFTTAFVAFIEDSYLSKINDYRGQQVAFLTARNDGPQYAQVNTNIIEPNGQDPIHVNYLLLQKDTTWKIYDVTVDAISIIANYRNQFNRVMNNKGYDTLISDLKSKQAALAARLANH